MNAVFTQERSSISKWIQAIRPFSLTATFVPIILGIVIALYYYNGTIEWYTMYFILIGGPFFQIAGNLFSEYYDYKNKVDRQETYGSSRVLVDEIMKPNVIFKGALISILILFVIGIILTYIRGYNMFVLGIIGIVGSYLYTNLKYRALGDLHIYLSFGPLMLIGTIYALTGSMELLNLVLILSIPIGLLVTAILHANNTRDIMHDTEAKIRTFASLIGIRNSISYYYFLIIGAYISTIVFITIGLLPYWALCVLFTFPIALRNMKVMSTAQLDKPENINVLDVMTAQLHLLFGLSLSFGIILGFLFK